MATYGDAAGPICIKLTGLLVINFQNCTRPITAPETLVLVRWQFPLDTKYQVPKSPSPYRYGYPSRSQKIPVRSLLRWLWVRCC